jgi:hypothetical protein
LPKTSRELGDLADVVEIVGETRHEHNGNLVHDLRPSKRAGYRRSNAQAVPCHPCSPASIRFRRRTSRPASAFFITTQKLRIRFAPTANAIARNVFKCRRLFVGEPRCDVIRQAIREFGSVERCTSFALSPTLTDLTLGFAFH